MHSKQIWKLNNQIQNLRGVSFQIINFWQIWPTLENELP